MFSGTGSEYFVIDNVKYCFDEIKSEFNNNMFPQIKLTIPDIAKCESEFCSTRKMFNLALLNLTIDTELDMCRTLEKLQKANSENNYDLAFELLGNFLDLDYPGLSLLKHNYIVDNIIYISNLVPEGDTVRMREMEKVRKQANKVLNKFESLFTIPDGQSFQNIFNEEVKNFNEKTKDLSYEEKVSLTESTFK